MRDRLYMTAEVIEQLTRLYEEKEAVSPDKEAIGFARRQLASVSAVLKRTAEGERRRCYNLTCRSEPRAAQNLGVRKRATAWL